MIAGMVKFLSHYLQRVAEEEEGRESRGKFVVCENREEDKTTINKLRREIRLMKEKG